jgi:hypothetical protein
MLARSEGLRGRGGGEARLGRSGEGAGRRALATAPPRAS